jgi:hypothetical protein
MAARRDNFAPFVEDDENFDSYLQRMRADGAWAGQMEVQALVAARRVGVCIHQAGQPPWLIDAPRGNDDDSDDEAGPSAQVGPPATSAAPPPVYLHFTYEGGEHYNSVRCAEGGDDPSAAGGPRALPAARAPQAHDDTAADAAADVAPSHDVAAVLRGTGCADAARAARTLRDMNGDVSAAIEALIACDAARAGANDAANDANDAADAADEAPVVAPEVVPFADVAKVKPSAVRRAARAARKALRGGGGKGADKDAAAGAAAGAGASTDAAALRAPLAALRL